MAEIKKKPPRPPAPKIKKSGKTKVPSSSFTMHFNPRLVDDDEDDNGSDPLQISISKPPVNSNIDSNKHPSSNSSITRPKSLPSKPIKNSNFQDPVTAQQITPTKSSPVLSSPPLSPPQSANSRTSISMGDDPLHSFQGEQDPYADAFKQETTSTKGRKSRENSMRVKESGLLTVESEILAGDVSDHHFEGMSNDGSIDPLNFLSQLMEKEGYSEQQKPDAKSRKGRDGTDGKQEVTKAKSSKEGSLDLEIDPYYYNHPTPDELPDEPVAPQREKNAPISFAGLLEKDISRPAKTVYITEDENSSLSSSSDKGEMVEKSSKMKPPKEMTTFSNESRRIETESPSPKETDLPSVIPSKTQLTPPPPVFTLGVLTMILFIYMVYPLPSYLTGLISGMVISFFGSLAVIWLNLPAKSRKFDESSIDDSEPLAAPGERMSAEKVKLKVQEQKEHWVWMNELEKEYDQDTYHISQTQSVLLRLEGHILRLSTPRRNIPKRTMWDEEMPKPEFVYQRIFDMRGAEVNLRPEGLVQKRLWSKKYPIFINLPTKGKSRTKRDVQTAFNDETFTDCGDFEVIKDGECEDQQLILFARTGREKEEWFWRFEVAVKHDKVRGRKPIPTLYKKVSLNNNEYRNEKGELHHVKSDTYNPLAKKGMVDFYKFIAKVLPRNKDLKEVSIAPVNVKASGVTYASPTPKEKKSSLEAVGVTLDTPLAWANALIGRIFWDFLREEYWAGVVQTKLQKKLDKLRIPKFIEGLNITDTDLGVNSPIVRRASPPRIDHRGIWVYLDIAYAGSCCITLTTKFNPWKLGKREPSEREMDEIAPDPKNPLKKRSMSSAALDSEEEDSAESSDEEGADETSEAGSKTDDSSVRASGKFMRFVNRVANSNYFQKATQNKYVKRAFDEVSNTPVELTVEVKELRGTLAINIPPPPTDRLWYGFTKKPHLWLSAKPKLGARQVTLTHVTDYIEKKLDLEFQKVFVLPNMDDVVIPIMLFDVDENRL